jgi:hypothetical protein
MSLAAAGMATPSSVKAGLISLAISQVESSRD